MRYKKKHILLLTILTVIILGFSLVQKNSSIQGTQVNNQTKCDLLEIPSEEEILTNGYPVNENGQTYGPNLRELSYGPDLILAQNSDGLVGYVYSEPFNQPDTPEEALEYNKLTENMESIPMFLQDGITIIGDFEL